MNKYHIRIDGNMSPHSYTYQQLVDMELFELGENGMDGIEVKNVTESVFVPITLYVFHENDNNNQEEAYVDEYGQIIRPQSSNKARGETTATPIESKSETNYGCIIFAIVGIVICLAFLIGVAGA